MIMRLSKNEHLYVSKSIQRRLDGMLAQMRRERIGYAEVARLTNTNQHTVYSWCTRKLIPSLLHYINLAALMGWDLSRDVNRWYVDELIDRTEIYRRALRLYPECSNASLLSATLGGDMRITPSHVWKLFAPHARADALVFGAVLHHIMRKEKLERYSDALDLEE